MSPRLFALLAPFFLLVGCSTPASKDWLDTLFCWLRPSCLPSQPPQSKSPAKQAKLKPSSVTPKHKPVQMGLQNNGLLHKPTQFVSPDNDPPPCLTSTETTPASALVKRISYTEPTTQADGKTLTDLKKTSIYFQPGNDPKERQLIMECAATKDQGGGMIPEGGGTLQVKISEKIGPDAKICVTATDKVGNGGASICEPIRK